jgi:hypothetical protein
LAASIEGITIYRGAFFVFGSYCLPVGLFVFIRISALSKESRFQKAVRHFFLVRQSFAAVNAPHLW